MGEQRETFDEIAEMYAQHRPGVPEAALKLFWQESRLESDDSALEVGCGTGQLTRHLLARGLEVTCVEPGAQLAAICRRDLDGPALSIDLSTLEDWVRGDRRFHAVASCQAAHWIAPAVFLDRAADALLPGGYVGLLWHLDLSEGTEFWNATEPLYERFLPDSGDKPPRTIPGHVRAYVDSIGADARYHQPVRHEVPWQRVFDGQAYLGWLQTHSPVRMLPAEDRRLFVEGHERLIAEFGGEVTRLYRTVLVSTRLKSP